MNSFSSAALKADGFVGFVAVEALRATACAQIPEADEAGGKVTLRSRIRQ